MHAVTLHYLTFHSERPQQAPTSIRTSSTALSETEIPHENDTTKLQETATPTHRLSPLSHHLRDVPPQPRSAHSATIDPTNTSLSPPILRPSSAPATKCLDQGDAWCSWLEADRSCRQRLQQRTSCCQGPRCCYFRCVDQKENEICTPETGKRRSDTIELKLTQYFLHRSLAPTLDLRCHPMFDSRQHQRI